MKSWVPILRILLVIACLRTVHWISDTYPEQLLTFAAEMVVLVLTWVAWLYLGRFEPHITFPCPHCGHGNIKERRICKRCRGAVPPPEPSPPEESPPLIQHWVEVEVSEIPKVRG